MKYLIIVLIVASFILYIVQRWKIKIRRQQRLGVKTILEKWREHTFFSHFYTKVKEKTDYTKSSLNRLTLISMFCMVPGGVVGLYLKNMELGLLLSAIFASYPLIRMLLLERKKQKHILKNAIPLLTSIDWGYKSNSFSVEKALIEAKGNVPEIIQEEYQEMLQKINAGMRPSVAMSAFGKQTKSAIFFNLSGILAVQEKRNNPEAFNAAIKLLISNVVKTNNRISNVDANLNEKKLYLVILLFLTVFILSMTFQMMDDPLYYFRTAAGSRVLIFGVLSMFVPFVLYFMSSLRRRY